MNFRFLFGESVINLPGAALNYIQKASASELRVLIAAAGGKYASFDELAADAGVTAGEAETALSFWRGAGLLESGESEKAGNTAALPSGKAVKPEEPSSSAYTGKDVERIFAENARLRETVEMAQTLLGKGSFTPSETKIIVYLSDYMRLDNEFILLLISYCVKIGKASLRYIEKTAIGLYDKNIDNVAALEAYIKREDEKRTLEYKIRALFGIGERALIKSESDCLENWVKLAIPFELIEYGYEKMMKSPKVTRPSFSYENKMLMQWHEAGLKTPADVEEYEKKGKKAPAAKSGAGFDLDEFFNLAASRGAGKKEKQ